MCGTARWSSATARQSGATNSSRLRFGQTPRRTRVRLGALQLGICNWFPSDLSRPKRPSASGAGPAPPPPHAAGCLEPSHSAVPGRCPDASGPPQPLRVAGGLARERPRGRTPAGHRAHGRRALPGREGAPRRARRRARRGPRRGPARLCPQLRRAARLGHRRPRRGRRARARGARAAGGRRRVGRGGRGRACRAGGPRGGRGGSSGPCGGGAALWGRRAALALGHRWAGECARRVRARDRCASVRGGPPAARHGHVLLSQAPGSKRSDTQTREPLSPLETTFQTPPL